MTSSAQAEKPLCQADLENNVLTFHLSGDWILSNNLPKFETVLARTDIDLFNRDAISMAFNLKALKKWDSGLLTFLLNGFELSREAGTRFIWNTLPDDIRKLLELATAIPEKKGTRDTAVKTNFFERVGYSSMEAADGFSEAVIFCGDCIEKFMNHIFTLNKTQCLSACMKIRNTSPV